MRAKDYARSTLVVSLLLALLGTSALGSTLAPADQPQLTLRERETLRWGTGPGTEVDGNVQVTPAGGGGAPLTFKLDNQTGPLGGGVQFTCPSTGGKYQVGFAYRNLAGSDPLRQVGLQLMCLPPFNPLELRANGLARRVEFQDNTEVLRTITVPLDPTFRVRPDNRPTRGGLEIVCESPYEGRIDYRYKFRGLDPPVVDGVVVAVCLQF